MIQPEEASGRKIWLLSRALVVHKFITFPEEVKGSKRFNLVNLQARTHSPYDQMRSYMHWTPRGVSVWMWDHKAVQRKLRHENLEEKQFSFAPETAYADPFENGARLVECSEGVEGQIWQDTQLVASRWWHEAPPEAEWITFIRGAGAGGLALDHNMPAIKPFSKPNDKVWTHTRPIAGGFTVESLYSAEALAVLALILLLPVSFYTGKIFHAWGSISSMQSKIASMGTDTEKVELQKKAAERNLKKINTLVGLNPYPHPIHILKNVIAALEDPTVNLSEFKMTGDLVTLLLQGETTPDPAMMVTIFEKVPEFDKVNADPGRTRNTLKVTFKVQTKQGSKKKK